MGRRRQKRKKSPVLEYRRLSTEALYRRIEERCAGGSVRVAIEIAKECYRRDASPKHVELLGGLYVRRARGLAAKNLHVEAFAVLNHALSLGYGSQELLHLAFECGVHGGQYEPALRMLDCLREPELCSRASRLLTDEAIAEGDEIGRLCEPQVREDAARIRRAFASFERGADGEAATELKSIGLRSPCAGWKRVLLGLLAYYREDEAKARSCWARVGDEGGAARLAGLLLSSLDDGERPDGDSAERIRGELLSNLRGPRVAMLESIKQAVAEGDIAQALRLSSRLLATVSPEQHGDYARRLGRVLVSALDSEPTTWREFRRVFGAFPEDPLLLRLAAIQCEQESPEDALGFWEDYLGELRRVEVIPPPLRARARALIWRRMGDLTCQTERMNESMPPFFMSDDLGPVSATDAVRCYRKSIKDYPDDLQTHEKLLQALVQTEGRGEVERQAEEMLERWPTHIDSLLLLGENCFRRRAFRKALKYFDRAREAEPFNTKIDDSVRACLLYSARRRLDKGNFQLARADYEQAAALCGPHESSADVYCKWAALEWRAGNPTAAERLYTQAESGGEEPLALYYLMVIDLRRARAPRNVQDRFEKLLAAEWKKRPTGAQAAAVAEVARQHEGAQARFDGCEELQGSLWRYFKRACKKAVFTEEQLLGICRYLEAARGWELLEQFARRGVNQFRANYFFPRFLGQADLGRGKWPLREKTIRLLHAAGEQATRAGAHEVAEEIAALVAGGSRLSSRSIYELLERVLFGAEQDDLQDLDDGPSDGFEDGIPLPRTRRRRRKPDRDQLPLFDDAIALETESH